MTCLPCLASPEVVGDRAITKKITVEAAAASVPVVLFLGSGESGKSTFFRQLRLLHGGGYTPQEREQFQQPIRQMIIHDIHALIVALDRPEVVAALQGGPPVLPSSTMEAMRTISEYARAGCPNCDLTTEMAGLIAMVWTDSSIQQVYELKRLFHLGEHAAYFFGKVHEIAKADWMPNDQDLVTFRVRTTGVCDQKIVLWDNVFRIVDVGGQRSERRKWIMQFSGVAAILFVVATSEYDQTCLEDNVTNRLDESLGVFVDVCRNEAVKNSGMIVFFNKTDLFLKKLPVVPFGNFIKDYTGDGSPKSVSLYIVDLFTRKANDAFKEISANKRIYPHWTTAIDRGNVKKVFDSLRDIILRLLLSSENLL
ncbi:G-protein alpha subunit [Plasmodiophora brassicae]